MKYRFRAWLLILTLILFAGLFILLFLNMHKLIATDYVMMLFIFVFCLYLIHSLFIAYEFEDNKLLMHNTGLINFPELTITKPRIKNKFSIFGLVLAYTVTNDDKIAIITIAIKDYMDLHDRITQGE